MDTAAKQAVILDYDTNIPLLEKNANQRMPTSSMSKVITAYAVFDAVEKGILTLEDKFLVSKEASEKGGSKMFVAEGTRVALSDLLKGIIVQSGNDACIVVAQGMKGSEDSFAGHLNKIATDLGMKDSHFANASGWPDPNHYSTAADLAKLAVALIKDFPQYYKYYSLKSFTYADIEQKNRNPLLFSDVNADGIKTGHTEDGGYGLIGSAVAEDGRRVIMVLNGMESEQERAQESERLMKWALNNFKKETFFSNAKTPIMVPVKLGKVNEVALKIDNPLTTLVPTDYEGKIKLRAEYKTPLVAPVSADEPVGVLYFTVENLYVRELPLYVSDSVEEAGFFRKGFLNFKATFDRWARGQ